MTTASAIAARLSARWKRLWTPSAFQRLPSRRPIAASSTRRWNHSLPRVHAEHEAQAEKLEKLFTVSGSQTMNNFSNFHNPTCTEDTPAQRRRGAENPRGLAAQHCGPWS